MQELLESGFKEDFIIFTVMPYQFQTTKERSELMQKIRSINTKPEVFFRKLLWAEGIRYRKNNTELPGKPDISISKKKIVIFIDGEFWHGFDWENKKSKIKANRDYWIPKIERNIERDRKNKQLLENNGWIVLRFWESDIKKNPTECLERVLALIKAGSSRDESI